jgi:hypothetical protein
MARRIKYMGSADNRTISTGEDWGGRLGTPVSNPISFTQDNNRIVDVEAAGWSEAAISLLLEDPMFIDVTGAEIIPAGLNEQYFLGIPETPFVSRADGRGNEVYHTPAFSSPLESYEDLTVAELQDRAGELGLPKSGKKDELAERIQKATKSTPAAP